MKKRMRCGILAVLLAAGVSAQSFQPIRPDTPAADSLLSLSHKEIIGYSDSAGNKAAARISQAYLRIGSYPLLAEARFAVLGDDFSWSRRGLAISTSDSRPEALLRIEGWRSASLSIGMVGSMPVIGFGISLRPTQNSSLSIELGESNTQRRHISLNEHFRPVELEHSGIRGGLSFSAAGAWGELRIAAKAGSLRADTSAASQWSAALRSPLMAYLEGGWTFPGRGLVRGVEWAAAGASISLSDRIGSMMPEGPSTPKALYLGLPLSAESGFVSRIGFIYAAAEQDMLECVAERVFRGLGAGLVGNYRIEWDESWIGLPFACISKQIKRQGLDAVFGAGAGILYGGGEWRLLKGSPIWIRDEKSPWGFSQVMDWSKVLASGSIEKRIDLISGIHASASYRLHKGRHCSFALSQALPPIRLSGGGPGPVPGIPKPPVPGAWAWGGTSIGISIAQELR